MSLVSYNEEIIIEYDPGVFICSSTAHRYLPSNRNYLSILLMHAYCIIIIMIICIIVIINIILNILNIIIILLNVIIIIIIIIINIASTPPYHEEAAITRLEMVQQEGKTIHCGGFLVTVLEQPGHQHRSIEGAFFRASLSDRLFLPC